MSARRRSRRILGTEPQSVAPQGPLNLEMTRLLTRGGANGKLNPKHSDWNYFPTKKRVSSMISMCELQKEVKDMKNHARNAENDEQTRRSTYCLLHADQLKTLVNFKCDKCKGNEESVSNNVNIKTYGMASAINLQCSGCETQKEISPRPSSFTGQGFDGEPTARPNNSWYESNLRLVLGSLAVGNGGTDLSDMAAFMGLPQASSFGKRPFNKIECVVGESIRQVAHDSMKEALEKEVIETLKDLGENYKDFEEIMANCEDIGNIKLTVSFDMGWQKRSSGSRYDSLSGHAFMIGARTKLIIQCIVSSKMCATCLDAEDADTLPKPHSCPRNYTGSSKAMEPDAALAAYELLHQGTKGLVSLGHIITDDDSSMRSYLKHPTTENPKGNLPTTMPEPQWLADPTHRTKIIAKHFYNLVSRGKKKTQCTRVDAGRIKRWWGHMVKMYRDAPYKRFKRAAKSVLEHLFDDHRYCDRKWCIRLRQQTRNMCLPCDGPPARKKKRFDRPPSPERSSPLAESPAPSGESHQMRNTEEDGMNKRNKRGYYRSKVEHQNLYKQMKEIFEKLTSDDRLRECHHRYDSQVNEALNVSVGKYARKGRTYCTTMSLTNRVNIAMGTHNLGYHEFWYQRFKAGI